ncbi:hypothetical protein [Actinomyces sp.]|uniref:hypothetical protein n=1 Tax=Actinomyces sp. TaxID=29317 RepID=UPI0026DBBF18|nr:hypothetical protein [Actinomyces sp.]MDO4900766.1 hypothetical protein [Actinomyces sp.]
MQYDLIVRFDTLSTIASRLDGEQANLSAFPTDWSVTAQQATSGFPEAFNTSLTELATTQRSLIQQINTVSEGVMRTSSNFAAAEEEVAASARHIMQPRGVKP